MIETLFFDLIRVAIGNQVCLSQTSHSTSSGQAIEAEWGELYSLAKKQSLVGVCFAGVQKLVTQQQEPPEMLYLTWMGMAAKIQQRNEVVNRQCVEIGEQLSDAGFEYVVMKGQEVGRFYGDLLNLRQSGDIDVWITNKDRQAVVDFANSIVPTKEINHHHLHFHVFDDTEVELHFIPIELHCPWYDRNLQRFARSQVAGFHQCEAGYMVPTLEFDLLHQLAHSFRHLFGDGIGMRQVMDFYMVLRAALEKGVDWTAVEAAIRATGMKHFAEAMLWVCGYVFEGGDSNLNTLARPSGTLSVERTSRSAATDACISKNLSTITPNEKLGRFLLNEVMLAGNFGHTDERIDRGKNESSWHRFWRVNKQNLKLMRFSVWEVICTPPWRIVNYLWMKSHGYGLNKK